MADHDSIVSSDKLEAIADAIREKTQKEDTMTLDEMPDEIRSISGGGETPQCGIVPISWASNGFVLTADSYGDIMPGALCSSSDIYYIDTHDPNIPGNIDIYELSLGSAGTTGQQIFNFLHNIDFIEPVSYIGDEAFTKQYRMICNSLPNGLTYIGYNAFESCYNTKFDTIPNTITEIGDYAFANSNKPEELVPNYDSTATYDIGDIVYYSNYVYTCIIAVSVAEEFDYNHWVEGYYPEILGIYNPSNTYQNGDIVYDSDQSRVCTCCYIGTSSVMELISGYTPDLIEEYNPNHTYHTGDVVAYDDGTLYKYVCISPNSVTGEWDSIYWSGVSDFVLNSIRFLGTPETIGESVFDYSGYNFILVPWEEGAGPSIDVSSGYVNVIYGFVGE